MKIVDTFRQIFTLPDLRKKIIIVAALLLLARVLAHIPLPGVDIASLRNLIGQNAALGVFNMFSGGTMENFSIILMGVGPYITSSIVFQLLTIVIPSLDELNKEGESGRAKINYWTRLATVPFALIQSFAMIRLLQSQSLLQNIDSMQWATLLISITAGTILLMWLGELISEKGIGNGISLIIALGILSGIPTQIARTWSIIETINTFALIGFAALVVVVIVGIILANEGMRQIPVSYARRVRGLKAYGGVDTHLPIKVNSAGVIPIIFALSILSFPALIGEFLKNARTEWIADAALYIVRFFNPNSLQYGITYFLIVIAFTYFYTGIIFKPDQMAENLQKQGGFVPGIRPGRETSQYLSMVINRLTLVGAIFLGIIAVLPFVVQAATGITTLVIGGTGVLILVSVIIETMRQIQAQLAMRTYEIY